MGSLLLAICSLVHITLLVRTIGFLKTFGIRLSNSFKKEILILIAFTAVVAAHTVQVWLWAFSLVLLGAFNSIADAVYFSLVTYTTLGYGDVTLNEGVRIFGAMAAVTGLLNFGLSTAFLVGVFTRLIGEYPQSNG